MRVKGGVDMKGLKAKCRIAVVVIVALCIGITGLYGLLKPISNGCVMTYMYPTYIPISTPKNVPSAKYGLYLYHEGWRQIDFNDHLKKLKGVPVLFIPGNGGSYKQVRSLAAESDRAYQGGPIGQNFASTSVGWGMDIDLAGVSLPNRYRSRLDWFAVDLEGEHSAMDGRILQEHTEYVVHAIHKILDQYKESFDARSKEGAFVSGTLPKSVVLVGHSMGGFVARAATVHPSLRKFAVETILTLSTPHQYPPLPLQPSLGNYYSHINEEWRKGYYVQTSGYSSNPSLSNVIVVSISGGYNDYQVRSNLESLDGVVPPTHGFMISSTSMENVWLSMEHQVILWCNQLVVQVSHTLLSLIDLETSQPLLDVRLRLGILSRMLRSDIPQSFISLQQFPQPRTSDRFPRETRKVVGRQVPTTSDCPNTVQWNEDGLEGDLHILTKSVTILSMDGRRRWLDIQKQVQQGDSHFVFVTNLPPCSGVRLHLWKKKGTLASESSGGGGFVEVTSKMVHIPSGSAPRQTEPGSQTEQPPPSAIFWIGPQDMDGFRFLTISVAPSPTVSGGPPPAASMGVGQFFNPISGEHLITPYKLFHSLYSSPQKEMNLSEDHPLALNLTFSASLGLLPVYFTVRTTGCGIKRSGVEELRDDEASKLCKMRCFPPVALSWDATSGLRVFPNFYTESVVMDSSPALWTSSHGSGRTSLMLLVDPHCSYKTTIRVSVMAAAGRFLLSYFPQISSLSVAVVFFALMQQASAWEIDQPLPSLLSAVELNLIMPQPFLLLAILPIALAVLASSFISQSIRPSISFLVVSILCYVLANGAVVVLIAITELLFYATAIANAFIKKRWQVSDGHSNFTSTKVVRIIRANPQLITSLVAIGLVWLTHPALGLFVLLISHALCCHNTLSSFLMTSFGSHVGAGGSIQYKLEDEEDLSSRNGAYVINSECTRSYGDRQLEIFQHRHGLLVLHLLAALMFVPSLVAWLQVQRIHIGQSFLWFWDCLFCTCVILHGICDSKPEFNFFLPPMRLSFGYLMAGYFSYFCSFGLAPYRTFYAMAAIGVSSFTFRIIRRRNGKIYSKSRKHSHRH